MQVYAQCFVSIAVFNIRWNSQFNAVLNIVRTLFVTFALGFAMITFNKDAQRLVLRPIERMLRKVKDVSENPLAGRGNSKIKVSSCVSSPSMPFSGPLYAGESLEFRAQRSRDMPFGKGSMMFRRLATTEMLVLGIPP